MLFPNSAPRRQRISAKKRTPIRTPRDKSGPNDRRGFPEKYAEIGSYTPEDVRKALRTNRANKSPLTPVDKILKKDLRVDFSPAGKEKRERKKIEETRRIREDIRLEKKNRQQIRKLSASTKCGNMDCILEDCGKYVGKNYKNNIDYLLVKLYDIYNA